MSIRYLKPSQTRWPELSDDQIERVEAVLADKLEARWVTHDELSSYQDMLFDHIIATRQTVDGELIVH
jgi:hypothetical protein